MINACCTFDNILCKCGKSYDVSVLSTVDKLKLSMALRDTILSDVGRGVSLHGRRPGI